MERPTAYILVVLQFSAIAWLIQAAYPLYLNITAFILCAIAVIVVAWALWVMRLSKIRILPMPHIDAELVMKGPYRFLRHPMYTSVLLFTAGLSLEHFEWYKFAIWLFLLLVLLVKLHWEEKMLITQFPEYKSYQQHSYKLIPFLY